MERGYGHRGEWTFLVKFRKRVDTELFSLGKSF